MSRERHLTLTFFQENSMAWTRRHWLQAVIGGMLAHRLSHAAQPRGNPAPLRITGMRVTPIALPDPPILAASGCHGPYFLRNIVELETDGKVVGVGETRGGQSITDQLEKARNL